jgi:hypothetical protein
VKRAIAVICAVIAAGAIYQLAFGERTVSGKLRFPVPVATLGGDEDAVVIASDGSAIEWFEPSEESPLPQLPAVELPRSGRLAGTMREQARVLGAAPPELRPHLSRSLYGETGVEVELRSGIELRFGDASQAALKWRSAAAVLADPAIESLDYVDLHAPPRPAIGGSGHTLPALP